MGAEKDVEALLKFSSENLDKFHNSKQGRTAALASLAASTLAIAMLLHKKDKRDK